LARTDVTSKVIAYIKEKNLQNPENKKEILLDSALDTLLSPSKGDIITFFNLQTYLKKHFIQNTVTVTATEEVTSA
jgi:chromatin remodeling complex protein RSC6